MLVPLLLALVCMASSADSSPFHARAVFQASRMVQCRYDSNSGTFLGDGLWQSGNTLETIASLMIYSNSSKISTKWVSLLANSYQKTPPIIDNCFDDHQWWLLAWVRAYQATSTTVYLTRAAEIFDYIVKNAWTDSQCGGGVIWCPASKTSLAGLYKNAITNELFLTSAVFLHPYTKILGRPDNFYLNWAIKEAEWFLASGMINSQGLINDGLTDGCKNNGGTTWTYNQGVLLSGMSALSSITKNLKYINAAVQVTKAVFARLTTGPTKNILYEPCSNCDGDQHLFKGIFVRHLGYAAAALEPLVGTNLLEDFLVNNSLSLIQNDYCRGDFGMLWQGPCQPPSTASASSGLDLLTAAAGVSKYQDDDWFALGLGNCADGKMQSMPNCFKDGIDEVGCRSVARADPKAVAYDVQVDCSGSTFCRVRTLGGQQACPVGWKWGGGAATTVSTTTGSEQTLCVLKRKQ